MKSFINIKDFIDIVITYVKFPPIAYFEDFPLLDSASQRKDYIITCMNRKDENRNIDLVVNENQEYQMCRNNAIKTALNMAQLNLNCIYMVTSLRGMKPHEVKLSYTYKIKGVK